MLQRTAKRAASTLKALSPVDLVYWRNRLISLSLAQGAFLGEEFPSDPSGREPPYPYDQCDRWDLRALPRGKATEHPQQHGLWVIPGALSQADCRGVSDAIDKLTDDNAVHRPEAPSSPSQAPAPQPLCRSHAPAASALWDWFAYGHARWMVPLQPSEGVCDAFACGPLSLLRSHNCTDARSWPALSGVDGAGGDTLRMLEALPGLAMPSAFGGRPPLFLQVQSLERGAAIMGHVDEHDVGGRAIATTVIAGGESEVRVGGVVFCLQRGDLYALCGAARDDVDHEVYHSASWPNRVSVTVRYGGLTNDVSQVGLDHFPYPVRLRLPATAAPAGALAVASSAAPKLDEAAEVVRSAAPER